MMAIDQVRNALAALGACDASRRWLGEFQGTPTEAWGACDQPDWMLWIAGRTGVDHPTVLLAACDCVEPVLAYVRAEETRPRVAIDAVRGWCAGTVSIEEVQAACLQVVALEAAMDAHSLTYDAVSEGAAVAARAVADAVTCGPRTVAEGTSYAVRVSVSVARRIGAERSAAAGEEAAAEARRAACDAIRARIPADMILAALAAIGRAA